MELFEKIMLPEHVDAVLTNPTYKMMIIIATILVAAVVIFSGTGDEQNESVSNFASTLQNGLGTFLMSTFFLKDGGKTIATAKDSAQLFGDAADVHTELAPF